MHRPVMNPSFVEEGDERRGQRRRLLRLAARVSLRALKLLSDVAFFDPLARARHRHFRIETGSTASRFVRGLLYRLAFLPLLLALMLAAIVWAATHPRALNAEVDPTAVGLYYDAVTCLTEDGVRIEGWLVPVVDARRVLEEKDKVLTSRHPAVVLVHDFAGNRQQMLPLVRPLHEAGFIVLVISTRGCGASGGGALTFGLNEMLDVKAAVEMLRRRPFIDPDRVAVIGAGSGASAALLLAREDERLAALVLDQPPEGAAEVLAEHLAPQTSVLRWMAPLCKWAFELGYHLNLDDLDLSRHDRVLSSRPILLTRDARPAGGLFDQGYAGQIRAFLLANLAEAPAGTATAR